jgi:O-antigen biosynthesis protein
VSTEHPSTVTSGQVIPEIQELIPVRLHYVSESVPGGRINLVVPGIMEQWLFGGVATALRFFRRVSPYFKHARIVATHQKESQFEFQSWSGWSLDRGNVTAQSVACLGDENSTLTVTENDVFVATAWMTALYVKAVVAGQARIFPNPARRFVYLIQDYEPAFYPWSARHLYAKSSYQHGGDTIAVFNSGLLAEYFGRTEHTFSETHVFEPILNPKLREARNRLRDVPKQRVIVVYGRPSTPRNDFDLVVAALRIWAHSYPAAREWSLVSVGESHEDHRLGEDVMLRSVGKLSLDEYATLLSRCWVGLSLMFSPHPSYPPLEMNEFRCWVITNGFENKDLSTRSKSVISLTEITPEDLAARLAWCCEHFRPGQVTAVESDSLFSAAGDEFPFAAALVQSWCRATGGAEAA